MFSLFPFQINNCKLLFNKLSRAHRWIFAGYWWFCKVAQGLQHSIWCYVGKQLYKMGGKMSEIFHSEQKGVSNKQNIENANLIVNNNNDANNKWVGWHKSLTVEDTLHRLRFCSDASLIASIVLLVTTTSCMPAMQSPAVNHSICTCSQCREKKN